MKQILKEIHETQKGKKKEIFQELLEYAENNELDFDLKCILAKVGHFVASPSPHLSRSITWLTKALSDFNPTHNLHLIRKSEHGDLVATDGVMMFILKLNTSGGDASYICPLTGTDIGDDIKSHIYPDYTRVIIDIDDSIPFSEFNIKLSERATLQNGERIYEYRVNGSDYGLSEKQVKAIFSNGGMKESLTFVKFCQNTGRVQFECGRRMAILSPMRI